MPVKFTPRQNFEQIALIQHALRRSSKLAQQLMMASQLTLSRLAWPISLWEYCLGLIFMRRI